MNLPGHESRLAAGSGFAQAPVLERALIAYARHFPIQKGKLRLVDNLWRVAAAGQGTSRLAELKYGGLKLPCDLAEMLQRQFYFFGTYFLEEPLLDRWMSAARHARVVFDIGANAGIYSLAALAVRPDAAVYAFEPTPEIAAGLRRTAQLNDLATLSVEEAAVLNRDGTALLCRYRGGRRANAGMNYIRADRGGRDGERVRTVSLDAYCARQCIARIDLIKIDVQGHEDSVLEGAAGLLASGRLSCVLLELNWAGAQAACPARRCIRLLEQAGYLFDDPRASGGWRKAGAWLDKLGDVIAARPEDR